MKTSQKGVDLIKRFEGLSLVAYQDPVGVWTIGYGHTSAAGSPKVSAGQRITKELAETILANDLAPTERAVSEAVKVPLSQDQFDALVSFTYNLGAGNLRSSTLLKKLNAGDYSGAAAEFDKWNKAGGRVLPGLTSRRQDERRLFESGKAPLQEPAPSPSASTIHPSPQKPPAVPAPAPSPSIWTLIFQFVLTIIKAFAK